MVDLSKIMDMDAYRKNTTINPDAPPVDQQLRDELAKHGIPEPPEYLYHGQIVKWGEPDKAGDNAYYYILSQSGGQVHGVIGSFRHSDSSGRQLKINFSSIKTREYTDDELEKQSIAYEAIVTQNNILQAERQKRVEYWIEKIYKNCDDDNPIINRHKYKVSKGIINVPGVKIDGMNNLIIPMIDDTNRIKNIQKIAQDGTKRFESGTAAGLFFPIEGDSTGKDMPTFLCEGYATGVSIKMATDCNVYCAFTANNLPDIAKVMSERGIKNIIIVADADDDQKGQKAAKKAATICNGKVVEMERLDKSGSDANDYMAKYGADKLSDYIKARLVSDITIFDLLEPAELTKEYIDKLKDTEWLIKHFLEPRTINVYAAPPNGGKSTITMNYICQYVLRSFKKYKVIYIDFDASTTDHPRMFRLKSDPDFEGRFRMVVPNTVGKDPSWVLDMFKRVIDSRQPMDNTLVIFDTLKKFADLMGKADVKKLFDIFRSLTPLGATIITLAHTNKNLAADGSLVVEGVGDIKNDTDVLYIFKPQHDDTNRIINVHAINDPGQGAKKRGDTRDQYFTIDCNTKDREVSLLDKRPDLKKPEKRPTERMSDEDVMNALKIIIGRSKIGVTQTDLLKGALSLGCPQKRTRDLLNQNSCERTETNRTLDTGDIYYTKGENNSRVYEMMR